YKLYGFRSDMENCSSASIIELPSSAFWESKICPSNIVNIDIISQDYRLRQGYCFSYPHFSISMCPLMITGCRIGYAPHDKTQAYFSFHTGKLYQLAHRKLLA